MLERFSILNVDICLVSDVRKNFISVLMFSLSTLIVSKTPCCNEFFYTSSGMIGIYSKNIPKRAKKQTSNINSFFRYPIIQNDGGLCQSSAFEHA